MGSDSLALALGTLPGRALGLSVQREAQEPRACMCILPRDFVHECGCGGSWAGAVTTLALPFPRGAQCGRSE